MKQYKMYINGEFCEASGGKKMESVNPSTGEVIAAFPAGSVDDTRAAVKAAEDAFNQGEWRQMPLYDRVKVFNRVAELIREKAAELARVETQDTGKTIKQTTFIDIPTAASAFEYFAQAASQIKGENIPLPSPAMSLTEPEPVGVVAQIIPWNYPFLMAAWKISQAVIMGNSVVLKPSTQASLSCLELAEIVHSAGFPRGVVNIISGEGADIGRELAQNTSVNMISFTGSTEVGKEIMRLASSNVKKLCLELGGKSPNIVFADCDLEAAVCGSMSAIFMNQGQMCTAGSRLLLEDKIHDKFLKMLVEKTVKLKIGNAAEYDTDFGPLISRKQQAQALEYVNIGKTEGACLLCGGEVPFKSEGFYFSPAIFSGVNNNMRVAREEIFAPVLSVIKFSGEDEAVRIANDTPFGLAAMVWSKDINRANRLARLLQAGTIWINTYGGFYNEAPFGGFKESGFGKELGREGLLEYTNIKHINVDLNPSGRPLVSNWFSV